VANSIAARRWLVVAFVLVAFGTATARADAFRGRPLGECLEILRERGLNVLYSTAAVDPAAIVTVEPVSDDPRGILDEILAPLGLEVREGAGGALLLRRGPGGSTGTLRGRVRSASSRRPIVGATVALEGEEPNVRTRPDGSFAIARVPAGMHAVRFSAPGFVDALSERVAVPPGRTVEVSALLQPQPRLVEEVLVTPSRHAVATEDALSTRTVEREDHVLIPAFGSDVARVVESLPGIASAQGSAAFHVRGTTTRDVSMVLDGLEIYQPFHLASLQSPFSFVDVDLVDTLDVLAGGFTAEHGDRHGGFVEMWTAAPEGAPRTRIEGGTINARVGHARPAGAGSIVLSARTWYPDALWVTTELGQDDLDPRFGDVYFKYGRAVSQRSIVSVHALAAFDDVAYEERSGNERLDIDNRSGHAWLRWVRSWAPAVLGETVVSVGRWTATRAGRSEPEDEIVAVEDDRKVNFAGLRQDLSWRPSDGHLLRAGVEVRTLEADYRYALGDPAAPERTSIDRSGTSMAAWATHRAALGERWVAEVGLRRDRQTYTDDRQTSPRVHLAWRAGERDQLRLSAGRFFQSHRIHELRIEDGETAFRPAELAVQADLTWQHRFDGGVRLRVDAYARELTRILPRWENLFNPIELFPETEDDRVRIEADRAKLRGVEILVQDDGERPLRWWASYALSSADDVVDGRTVPRSWDQTHAVKFLVARRWSPGWSASVSGTYHTGWPTTPVGVEEVPLPDGSIAFDPVPGPRNSIRYPAYARLDLRVGRTFAVRRGTMRVDVEVLNVTDRTNPCCVDEVEVVPDGAGGAEARREFAAWLGITPSLRVAWEF